MARSNPPTRKTPQEIRGHIADVCCEVMDRAAMLHGLRAALDAGVAPAEFVDEELYDRELRRFLIYGYDHSAHVLDLADELERALNGGDS